MSSKINLQTCEYARKSSIFQDNQLIFIKITLFFHYFSLLHRFRQRIEQRPPLWIQILFLIKCFFKKLCIFPLVIIRNMRVRIRNHIDLCMAGITLYCFDIR